MVDGITGDLTQCLLKKAQIGLHHNNIAGISESSKLLDLCYFVINNKLVVESQQKELSRHLNIHPSTSAWVYRPTYAVLYNFLVSNIKLYECIYTTLYERL